MKTRTDLHTAGISYHVYGIIPTVNWQYLTFKAYVGELATMPSPGGGHLWYWQWGARMRYKPVSYVTTCILMSSGHILYVQ